MFLPDSAATVQTGIGQRWTFFIGVAMWNDYMHFILYITDLNLQNFQVKIRALILEDALSVASSSVSLGANMLKSATILVVIVPFMLIYPFYSKVFYERYYFGSSKRIIR